MALTKCKECGKQISSKAKACPNCGATKGPGAAAGCFVAIFKLIGGVVGAIVALLIAIYFLHK